jgi:phosphoribosylglycinamide formyltransferase
MTEPPAAERRARVTVLCSGNGSNLQAIIDACATGVLAHVSIIKVITNRKAAFATTRAEEAGIPTEYFNLVKDGFQRAGEKDEAKLKEARARYDDALGQKLLLDQPDLVVLAGWMHVFTEPFLRHLEAAKVPIINLHPALPGTFPAMATRYASFHVLTWAGRPV